MQWENILRELLHNFQEPNITDNDNYYQFRFMQDYTVLVVRNHAWEIGEFNIVTGEITLHNEHIFTHTSFINELINACTHSYVQNLMATYTLNIHNAINQVPTQIG